MAVKHLPAMKIIGQVAGNHDMSANGSFYGVSQDFEDDPATPKMDQQLQAATGSSNRVNLVVFGPESSQFWVGLVVPATMTAPAGWQTYELPAGPAYEFSLTSPQYLPQVGVNFKMDQAYNAAEADGVKLPLSLGHAQLPYFLETMTFKKTLDDLTAQTYAIYQSDEIEALEDDLG